MTGLFLAQQIPGAAQIQVVAGQAEPGAQRIQGLQYFQAFLRRLSRPRPGRQGEIGIGPALGAPDAATQLIQLREAKAVGAMHDQGIGGGNIQTRFIDRRGQQDIIGPVILGAHHVVSLARRHAAMRRDEFDFRHLTAQVFLRVRQIQNARADVKALSSPVMFAQDRFAGDHRVEGHDEGTHGQAIHGRGRDQA